MILPKMQLTEINGVELEILDTGSGEPVMFVHGGMGMNALRCSQSLPSPIVIV